MSFLDSATSSIRPAHVVRLDASRTSEFHATDAFAFGFPVAMAEDDWLDTGIDWDWSLGVEVDEGHGRVLAATGSAWDFDTPVPGGRVRAGGLTWIGVRPGFRRRGYLTAMIARHFQDCVDHHAPISMLYASEMPIYGRFGYGVGGVELHLTIPRGAALRDVPGADRAKVRFETASFEAHDALVESIDSRIGHGPNARPGWTAEVTAGLREHRFRNEPGEATTRELLRIAIVEMDGEPTAYALFYRDGKWEGAMPDGTATITEWGGVDGASSRALWGELVNLDLVQRVAVRGVTLDAPLMSLLVNWRACRPLYGDAEYVRIIDLPTALAARRYSAPIDLVLEVADARLPGNAGLWRLVGGPDGAEGTVSDADHGDVALDIRQLASLYLGGSNVSGPASVGLIRENTPGSLVALDTAFRSYLQPGTPRDF
jgi:predicted acetyltransferase